MCGAIPLLPLHACMAWTEKILPSPLSLTRTVGWFLNSTALWLWGGCDRVQRRHHLHTPRHAVWLTLRRVSAPSSVSAVTTAHFSALQMVSNKLTVVTALPEYGAETRRNIRQTAWRGVGDGALRVGVVQANKCERSAKSELYVGYCMSRKQARHSTAACDLDGHSDDLLHCRTLGQTRTAAWSWTLSRTATGSATYSAMTSSSSPSRGVSIPVTRRITS